MPRQTPLTMGHVETIAAKLRDLPALETQHRRVTKQEAVKLLQGSIRDMIDNRGYTLVQVAELLSKDGVGLSPAALRSYLSRAEPRKRARQTKGAAGDTPATPAPAHATPKPRTATAPQPQTAAGGGGTFQPKHDTEDI